MDQPYASPELFHFVGWRHSQDDESNFRTLCKVLKGGCVSAPPHRRGWGPVKFTVNLDKSLMGEELIVPVVTCFADIPPESLGIHVRKYGKFGLALPRAYLVRYGARPVVYFPVSRDHEVSIYGGHKLRNIEATFKGFQRIFSDQLDKIVGESERWYGAEPETVEQALNGISDVFAMDFLAFIKPFDADLTFDDRDSYYMEREWRRLGNVMFAPSDITRVVVASGYAERLLERFPTYSGKVRELPP